MSYTRYLYPISFFSFLSPQYIPIGAPVGSCLVGSKEFIAKARWFRKLFGGGMRQTGILAGAAAYAVTHNFPLLPRVHELTRKLEKGLEEIGCAILSRAETSMVSVTLLRPQSDIPHLCTSDMMSRSSTIPPQSVFRSRK